MSIQTSDYCEWLHNILSPLPFIKYPFKIKDLPDNGIYFFFEEGEMNGHCKNAPRIVRVGTHKNNNFKSRINDHYLLSGMELDLNAAAPKDRSIFRKNIGRALINRTRPEYLPIWNKDFTTRSERQKNKHKRDIGFEEQIEKKISNILRKKFGFKYIVIDNQDERMGKKGLESRLIGTLSHCHLCHPSTKWLGNSSSIEKIQKSGLWLFQHLNDAGITAKDKSKILQLLKSDSDK